MTVDGARPSAGPRKRNSCPRAAPGARMRNLWAKAQVAAQSARLLCERGDTDGAINRAYYAVFGAARAALASVRASLAQSKRHGTIFVRFQKHLVDERGFPADHGRTFLSRQMSSRHAADYGETQADEAIARRIVGDMDHLLASVCQLLGRAETMTARGRP